MRRLLLIAVLLPGCVDPVYPGEPVGTFEISGDLLENGCGASAVPAFDQLMYVAELRRDVGHAIFRRPQRPMVDGRVDDADLFEFSFRSFVPAAASPEGASCALTQAETMELLLGSASDDETADVEPPSDGDDEPGLTLTGLQLIEFEPTAGSSCAHLVVSQGGPFEAFPCRVEYELHGVETEPF